MENNLTDHLASTHVLENFVKGLEMKLAQSPNQKELHFHLADSYRKLGLLDKAFDSYKQALAKDPALATAEYFVNMLQGKTTALEQEIIPAPFVIMSDFLSKKEITDLWNCVDKNSEIFKASKITNEQQGGSIDHKIRSSQVLHIEKLKSVRDIFFQKFDDIREDINKKLLITPFDPGKLEMQLTKHIDGDFFKVHKDSGSKEGVKRRVLTYVYYFHQIPKPYTGGDLLLYDTHFGEDSYELNYTRIIPQNNSIVFFPSEFYHQVSPVESINGDDWDIGRFTVNGWFQRKA